MILPHVHDSLHRVTLRREHKKEGEIYAGIYFVNNILYRPGKELLSCKSNESGMESSHPALILLIINHSNVLQTAIVFMGATWAQLHRAISSFLWQKRLVLHELYFNFLLCAANRAMLLY